MLKDADIREPLFEFLEETFGKVRILEEKIIGKSRADVVMVTEDSIAGIEIKSDADTYQRLSSQIKDYDKFYDYNYVVVGTSHALSIEKHVPDYWGIITVEEELGRADFYVLRRHSVNPKVEYSRQLEILWRPELLEIQQRYAMPKYKGVRKEYVIDKLLERTELPEKHEKHIDLPELKMTISDILFERDYNSIAETLKEYRKGELTKRIENESDSQRKLELMVEKAEKGARLKRNIHRRRRRR